MLFACGKSEEKSTGGGGGADATLKSEVQIRIFDDDCKESNFIRRYSGTGDLRAHLRLINVDQNKYAIGLIGKDARAKVDFRTVTLSSPAVGSYTYEVVLRNKTQCAKDSEAGEDCHLANGALSEKRSFDISAGVTFVVESAQAPSSTETGSQPGILGQIIPGIIDGIKNSGNGKPGVIGTIIGAITNGIGGAQTPPVTDPNYNRCVTGVPADIL